MATFMIRYRVLARVDIRHAAALGLEHMLSEDRIRGAFDDGVVSSVEGDPLNECIVQIELPQQGTHEQRLDEIAETLQLLGYQLVRANIETWVADPAAERIIGGLASISAGRTISRHPLFSIGAVAIGIALVDWLAQRAEAEYEAWRPQTGGWVIAEVPREAASAPEPVMLPA
jgi:hypothetical protein